MVYIISNRISCRDINDLVQHVNAYRPYLIKVICSGFSKCVWFEYVGSMKLVGKCLVCGEHSWPSEMIKSITIRIKFNELKQEIFLSIDGGYDD